MSEVLSVFDKKGVKKFLRKNFPWLVILLLAICVGVLASFLNSNRQSQKELEEQLERQQLTIHALSEKAKGKTGAAKPVPVVESETIQSELNSLQELVTQEYIYTNSDKRVQDASGFLGGLRKSTLILTYDGTIKAGIDMSEIKVEVNQETRTIIVTLPDSKITDNNIPQESIVVVEAKDGLFNEVTIDDYNSFISEQKIIMEQKAIERGLLEKADKEARKAIQTFLTLMPEVNGEDGYKLVVQ